MKTASQVLGTEWHVAYLPPLGISSLTHFAILLVLFSCLPGQGFSPDPHLLITLSTPTRPAPMPPMPEPPPAEKRPPAPRDVGAQELSGIPAPVLPGMDVPAGSTVDAAGTEEDRTLERTSYAFENDSFSLKGMPALRGWKKGTGTKGLLGNRGNSLDRIRVGIPNGLDHRTEDAVKHALDWLKRHQSLDGHWDAAFDRCRKGGHCAGQGASEYNAGLTGLSLLAFLGHGETGSAGDYQDVVRRAVLWLRGQQALDGCIEPKNYPKHLYNHAIATMALAEAVAMDEYGAKEAAQRAVDYLARCQNPGRGWRYHNYNIAGTPAEEDGANDTSVTGWAVMALKSARVAKLAVPDSAFQGASAWLDEVYDAGADYKATFGYTKKKAFVHKLPQTTTSVGVLVRLLLGQNKGVQEGAATLLERTPDWKATNFYYWYYGSLALFQVGGESWAEWNRPMKETLCRHQETRGCEDGSWDPAQDRWGESGGRVYTTALGCLCLEVYYRYAQDMKVRRE